VLTNSKFKLTGTQSKWSQVYFAPLLLVMTSRSLS